MATNCKLIYGYTDHTGWWNETEAYYRHYDGYDEAIVPLLKKYGAEITMMNSSTNTKGHQWERLEDSRDGVTRPCYIYLVDISDKSNIKVTVLSDDFEFYKKYGISNYSVKMELVL